MKDVFVIIKKELKRFFTDYRMLCAMIFPGILIYLIYTIMGPVINNTFSASTNYTYEVYLVNTGDVIKDYLENGFKLSEYEVDFLDQKDMSIMQEEIKNEEVDLIVEVNSDSIVPIISLYFNSAKPESQTIYGLAYTLLNQIQVDPGDYKFILNPDTDLASNEQVSSMVISMILPFLLIILLCTSVMSVAPESIAGEKDRGTIATLLVTPLKRTHLAIGKIVSLACISFVGGLSSFIGTILSLPNLMSSAGGDLHLYYNALDYVYIFLIIFSVLLLFVGLYAVISAFAKSVKEASAYSSPIMVIVVIVGIISMVGNLPFNNTAVYFIPVYNSVVALSSILSLEANVLGIVISVVSNVVYAIILAIILGKMFNSERIMFNK